MKEQEKKEYKRLGKLLKQMQEGNMDVFSEFYTLTSDMVFYQISLLGVSDETIEDVAQEVYISFIKNYQKIENQNAVYKWLKQTAHNVTINYLKKSVNLHETTVDETDEFKFESERNLSNPLPLPEDVMENEASQKILMDILKELPPIQYQMIVWYYYNEENVKDIAEGLGVPEGTVKSNLFRARNYIKESVLKVEKTQGIKLYSISVAPLIMLIVEKEIDGFQECAVASSKSIINGVETNFAGKSAVGHSAKFSTGKVAPSKIVFRLAIGVVTTGVIIGGGKVASHKLPSVKKTHPEEVIENNMELEKQKKNGAKEVQPKYMTSEETYEAYRQALDRFLEENIFPDGEIAGGGTSDPNSERDWYEANGMEYDTSAQFAVGDIDLDGKDELSIFWDGYYMYTIGTRVFSYDDDNNNFIFKSNLGEMYSNGINIEHGLHLNYGGDMATIRKINSQTGTMEELGEYAEILMENWSLYSQNTSYPEEIDTNGEGRVYQISCGEYDGIYSVEDFKKFKKELIGDAKKIKMEFYDLTEENFDAVLDKKIQEIK